jgi:hypothetical protein
VAWWTAEARQGSIDALNVLVGNGKGNTLNGNGGNNILIAGQGGLAGAKLTGGAGNDLLIGGWTDDDTNAAALSSLMATWAGATDANYTAQAAAVEALLAAKVHDDGVSDTLKGLGAMDLFFARLNGTTKDTTDAGGGEIVVSM